MIAPHLVKLFPFLGPFFPFVGCHCILVLGMHRSGTSAITRVLSLLGYNLPTHPMGPAPGNEAGHWEPEPIVALNDAMLAELGTSWHDWHALPERLPKNVAKIYQEKISAALDEEYRDQQKPFVIKDPRICRFVPFFSDLLKRKGVKPFYCLILREPKSVAESLLARDGMRLADGLLLWLRHVLDAELHSRGHKRTVVYYDHFIKDWRKPINKVAQELGIRWPIAPSQAAPEIQKFVSKDLRHHYRNAEEVTSDQTLPEIVRRAFRAMMNLRKNIHCKESMMALDAIRHEFDAIKP